MAQIIKHKVCLYLVNPDEPIYKRHYPSLAIKKFVDAVKPDAIKQIKVKNIYRIGISDLVPLSYDFNVVVIPTSAFHFDVKIHSGHIILIVSLDAGNPKYSHGIYYQSLSLIRKFLLGTPVSIAKKSLFYRLKPEGKAIIVASMTDVQSPDVLHKLYLKLCKIKLDKHMKYSIIRILSLKRKLYYLYKESHRE